MRITFSLCKFFFLFKQYNLTVFGIQINSLDHSIMRPNSMKENKRLNELPFVNVFLLPEWNVFKEKLFLTILDAKIFFVLILILSENL